MMRFGCLVSEAVWLVLVSLLLLHSMVPVAIWAVCYAFLLLRRGLHSDWPLY